jgi:hypothetical protein
MIRQNTSPRHTFSRSGMRGIVATCLLACAALIAPLFTVNAQEGVYVGISVAPILFSTGQPSNVLVCFSSLEEVTQTLNDGDTFTFIFPTSIGTITGLGPIDVYAVTLTPANFTAAFTSTPSQRVVVTYHQIGATQVLNMVTRCAPMLASSPGVRARRT